MQFPRLRPQLSPLSLPWTVTFKWGWCQKSYDQSLPILTVFIDLSPGHFINLLTLQGRSMDNMNSHLSAKPDTVYISRRQPQAASTQYFKFRCENTGSSQGQRSVN